MFRWNYAIREILYSHGDDMALPEIYKTLEQFYPLDESDLRETIHGGRPAYQHVVRSIVSNLVQSGDVERVGRGEYSLTDQGRGQYEAERQI